MATDRFHRWASRARRKGSLMLGLAALLIVGYLLLVPGLIASVANGQRAYLTASLRAYAALVSVAESESIYDPGSDFSGRLVPDAGASRCTSAVAGLRAFGAQFVDADSYDGVLVVSHAAPAASMVSAASIIARAGCVGVPSASAVRAQLDAAHASDARIRGPADLVARLFIPARGGWFSLRRAGERLWKTVLASPGVPMLQYAADAVHGLPPSSVVRASGDVLMNAWVFVSVLVVALMLVLFIIWNWNPDRVSWLGFGAAQVCARPAHQPLCAADAFPLPSLLEVRPARVRPVADAVVQAGGASAGEPLVIVELEMLTMRYLAQIAEWMGCAVKYGGLRADERFFMYITMLADRIEHVAQWALEGVSAPVRASMLVDNVMFMRNLSVCFRSVWWTASARPDDAALVALLDRLAVAMNKSAPPQGGSSGA